MPRSVSGNYTLPLPPVVPNTTIEADWANTTDDDIAQALTDSLDRYGRGGMAAPFRLVDGSETVPAFAFASETGTGLWRDGAGVLAVSVQGAKVGQWSALGYSGNFTGPIAFDGQVGLADGAAAAPSLTFVAEPTTGLFRASAGNLGLSILGTQKANVNATGLQITGALQTTADAGIGRGTDTAAGLEIGGARTVDGASYIDLVTATGSPDYNLRLLRSAGTNGATDFRHVGTGAFNVISQGSGPLQFFVNELQQFSLTSNQATNIGNPSASGSWRTIHWPQTVSEVAWSQASLGSGVFGLNASPSPVAVGSNTFEFTSGSSFRQRLDGASAYPIHTFKNKTVTAASHTIGAILWDAFRDVTDPSYVGGIWVDATTPAGNVPTMKFGAQQNAGIGLPTGGAIMQLVYDGHWQLSSAGGGYTSVYSGSNNSTKPSYMSRAVLGNGEDLWGFQITAQSGEPTTYRFALAVTVTSISPGYPQHVYKFMLNQYNEFNSISAQVLGTTGQWQFYTATGIISSAHLKTNWAYETGGLVDGLAAIADVGSFDIAIGDGSPAIAAQPALPPSDEFPLGRPAIVARPAAPPVTLRQVGTTAEAIEAIMPAAVTDAGNGMKSVAYGNAALVAAIALAKRVKAIEAFVGM